MEFNDSLLQRFCREVECNLLEATVGTYSILLVMETCIENKDITLLDGVGVVVVVEILCARDDIAYGNASKRGGAYSRIFTLCNLHYIGALCSWCRGVDFVVHCASL